MGRCDYSKEGGERENCVLVTADLIETIFFNPFSYTPTCKPFSVLLQRQTATKHHKETKLHKATA